MAAVLAACGCGPDGTNPVYPPAIFPRPSLTVTEGESTTFLLGLEGGPMRGVTGVFYQGAASCPMGAKVSFEPCSFDFSSSADYPISVVLNAASDADTTNEEIDVSVYLSGEAAAPDADLAVFVVDRDALNVAASTWTLTLAPSSSAEFFVRLTQPPNTPVSVDLRSRNQNAELQITPMTLSFDASNFALYQPVTVTATGDVDGEQIELLLSNGTNWGSVHVSGPFPTDR